MAEGVPLDRLTMHLRTLHPQFWGARLLWRPGLDTAELRFLDHGIAEDPRFQNSPVRALYEGADGIRRRLDMRCPTTTSSASIPSCGRTGSPTMWPCRSA